MMKQIITLLVCILYSSLVFAGYEDANTVTNHCGISTETSVVNAVNYMGQMKTQNNNPYEHFLLLGTEAKDVGAECTVVVNFKLKLWEYAQKQGVLNSSAANEVYICSENTSLLGSPANLESYLREFIQAKIQTCIKDKRSH